MPIRMEKDPAQESGGEKRPQEGQGGTGQNPLLKLLPFLLLFVFKKPKLLIPLLAIAAVWYFFLGGKEMFGGSSSSMPSDETFSLGATLDQERFDKAEVFEPLAYGYSGNSLPPAASLRKYCPKPLHQGRQGSCVGWASAYAARTIQQARATGNDPNSIAFSPAYLYNQIALEGCQGAYMLEAMKTMKDRGALPLKQFGYDDSSCDNYPSDRAVEVGRQYTIKGYNRLTLNHDNYTPDIMAIKQNLAQGAPVVIGMMVGGSFMTNMRNQKMWFPTQRDRAMSGYSGHAMCVVGYDDNMQGGAFQLMNSWGEEWGDRGFAWVRYPDFEHFVKESYGLYPMGSSQQFDPGKMAVEFGLLDINTQNTIALQQKEDIVFQTVKPIRKGDKFKVLVANSIECYIYVFGQETDGSSYVLFPYTDKHSPYCGITGTRLFPKDYSMKADELGSTDYMAVVVSKTAIDFKQFNKALNMSTQRTYAGKLREALANQRITDVKFQAGKTIAFEANAKDKNAVGVVIALEKR